MNSLYNHGIKQTQQLTKDLVSFEKNLSTSPLSLQGSISTTITAFKKTIKEYNDLVQQNTTDETKTKHELRLAKFNQDLADFTSKFDSLRTQREQQLHENNTQELLGRRHHAANTPENPYDQQSSSNSVPQQLQMSYSEGLYNEKMSLGRGSERLDQILEMGQQAFEDIVEQNETLRKLQEKFEQSLVTLGVSQGTIRTISRRAKQDKWLFWLSLVVMIIIFWYILHLFR
jgi:Golgi SNAP receptor complex protein 2